MHTSDIAKFRQEQALHEQAAQQGLYGFAAAANHASINARMQRGAEYLLTLLEAGQYEKVLCLMETASWGREEERCPMMTDESTQSPLSTEGTSSL